MIILALGVGGNAGAGDPQWQRGRVTQADDEDGLALRQAPPGVGPRSSPRSLDRYAIWPWRPAAIQDR